MTDLQVIALVFEMAAACVATIRIFRAIGRRHWRLVDIARIQIATWNVILELEDELVELYAEFDDDTLGWVFGGRLGEALRERKAKYKCDRADVISRAEKQLKLLDLQARELMQPQLIAALLEQYAVVFPSVGVIRAYRIEE